MSDEERIEELREELRQVKTAIAAIQSGAQEYRIGSRQLRRADLALLYKERDRLEREILSAECGGSIFHHAYFEGR
ncbi:hypothetical protein [Paenibacillus antibioticophila]|uniref:hypothetical protein n=1 Tax=Paenibacillus antibioticophila TaxID=1274374 RepID=UPI0005CA0D4D|nr:hypothetical protein [Paenibacillus antibioticophila]